eukprot:7156504-Prorocentrum_lima.AAC.1
MLAPTQPGSKRPVRPCGPKIPMVQRCIAPANAMQRQCRLEKSAWVPAVFGRFGSERLLGGQ